MRRLLFTLVLAGLGGEAAADARRELIETFAPEIVGKVLPAPSVVGEWAMAIDASFGTFVTMEMHVSETRRAAMRMTLTPAGTARVCVGAREHQVTSGQYHYKPAGQREHRESDSQRLMSLAGTYRMIDGVATIDLDTIMWNACELGAASKLPAPYAQLRCVGSVANPTVPAATLLCEVADQGQLLGVGLPLTPDSVKAAPQRFEQAPRGKQIVLGAPGLQITLRKEDRDRAPAIKLKPDSVSLVEKDYLPKPPPPRPPRPKSSTP
ncbi:MAG: hypothetical protein KIT31_13515 [Deltaproteobacteria bacterium]|nr:hypothetical protein [Deltaproteobacteria bacterium]